MDNRKKDNILVINDIHGLAINAWENQIPLNSTIILDLTRTLINNADLKVLFDILPLLPNIHIIGLTSKELDNKAIKYLTEALKKCPKDSKILSTELNFYCNHIDFVGAKYLANILFYTKDYFKINLACNNIQDLGLYYFLKNLKNAPLGFELNLSSNKLGYVFSSNQFGANYFAEALKNAPAGFKLNLSHNYIRDNYAIQIAESLKFAPSGFELDLSDNHIEEDGVEAFRKNLCNAPKGFKLNLLDNPSQWSSKEKFIEVIPNSRVIDLKFFNTNVYNQSEYQKLEQALIKNRIKYAALGCLTFLKSEFIAKLPTEIIAHIFSYVFPVRNHLEDNRRFVNNVLRF